MDFGEFVLCLSRYLVCFYLFMLAFTSVVPFGLHNRIKDKELSFLVFELPKYIGASIVLVWFPIFIAALLLKYLIRGSFIT